jgi:hypothetical protein
MAPSYVSFLLFSFLRLELQLDSWQVIALEAVYAVVIGFVAKKTYSQYAATGKRD